MDKYAKAVLTVIALCVLALPVKAEEKVWYCVTTQDVGINPTSINQMNPTRFILKTTPTKVEFSGDVFMGNLIELPIISFSGGAEWFAMDRKLQFAEFYNGSFSFVRMYPRAIVAVLATCEEV